MSLQIFLKSLIIWIIPFVISFGFYDKSGQIAGNYWIFKITMIGILVLTTFFTFKNYYKDRKQNWLEVSAFVIVIQIIIDLLVLVLGFKMNIWLYLYSILPIYVVFITLTNYHLAKKTIK